MLTYDARLDLATGDLPLVSSFVSGPDLTVQRAKIRLQTFLGEWILDQAVGLPFVAWRESKPPDVGSIAGVVLAELAATPGIRRVESTEATFDPDDRIVRIIGTAAIEDIDEVDEVTRQFVVSIGGNATPAVVAFYSSGSVAR
jgi:hypothetical protein